MTVVYTHTVELINIILKKRLIYNNYDDNDGIRSLCISILTEILDGKWKEWINVRKVKGRNSDFPADKTGIAEAVRE